MAKARGERSFFIEVTGSGSSIFFQLLKTTGASLKKKKSYKTSIRHLSTEGRLLPQIERMGGSWGEGRETFSSPAQVGYSKALKVIGIIYLISLHFCHQYFSKVNIWAFVFSWVTTWLNLTEFPTNTINIRGQIAWPCQALRRGFLSRNIYLACKCYICVF